MASITALGAREYDRLWRELDDFIRFHPGARHRRRWCLRLIDGLSYRSYLDVGCGPGDFLSLVHQRAAPGVEMWGADLSPEVVQKNQKRLPGVNFVALNIEETRLERSFDLISCQEVIEHLNDRDKAMGNLSAMLNPNGHLLLSCPTGTVYETERHFGHTTHPTISELQRHANRHGLEIIRAVNWGFPTYAMLKFATNINAQWAIKNFATGRYSWAQKRLSDALYYLNYLNVASPLGCQLFVLLRKR